MTESELETYLYGRLRDPKTYRGLHVAQHNRLGLDKILAVLSAIRTGADVGTFAIPPGDDPLATGSGTRTKHAAGQQHPWRTAYPEYLGMVDAMNRLGAEATCNSLKKNHFPNLKSMGLLIITPGRPRTGQLSPAGAALLDETDARKQQSLYGEACETLFNAKASGFISELFDILEQVNTISDQELMLFVSDRSRTRDEHLASIRAFRRLPLFRRIMLLRDLREHCDATMLLPKVKQLDWGNWRNQAQQIISMLAMVPGFVVPIRSRETVVARRDATIPEGYRPQRSREVRQKALSWHGLPSTDGWEMHHIVPVEYATCDADMQRIDAKQNLLYITKNAHDQFAGRGNLRIRISSVQDGVISIGNVDPARPDSTIDLVIGQDVRVRADHLDEIMAYNGELLTALS